MDRDILLSVENFTNELEKQIKLFETLEPKTSYYEDDYIFLKDILSNQNIDINNISIDDLVKLDLDNIDLILSKISIDKNTTMHFLYNFPKSKQEYLQSKTTSSKSLLEELLNLINDFVSEVNQINSNRALLRNNKLELYKKYLELFSNEQDEIFFELDELKQLMSSLGISSLDQWHIVKYINEKNLKNCYKNSKDINLVKEVTDYINKYLKENDEDVIRISSFNKLNIDVDLLPTTSKELAKKLNIPENKCFGILASLVLNSLLNKYENILNEDVVDLALSSRLRDMMKTILNKKINLNQDIIDESIKILVNNEEFIKDNEGLDLKELTEKSVSELALNDISYDDALKLKTLPILKSINETLEKINKIDDKEDKDYKLCCGVLEELNEAYNNMQDKIGMKRVI